MVTAFTIIFFLLGLIIGSFLNVVILRFNTKKSLGGRSACMSCQNKLAWYELIPLLSFVALGGRCLTCKSRIGAQYPSVEFLTGFIFMMLFLKFQDLFYFNPAMFSITYVYYAVAFSILLVIAVYDLRHKVIPDTLALVFGLLAFGGLFFFSNFGFNAFSVFYPHIPSMMEFLAGPVIALPFALLWLLSGGTAMGLGDAKLALGLGWLLGLSQMASAIMVAVWSGAIVGIFLIIFSKSHGMKSEIPFAPFLLFGAFAAFIMELRLFAGLWF